MSFDKNSRNAIIICGYIRMKIRNDNIPDIITSFIVMFYNSKHEPCFVYNNKWISISKNVIDTYINGQNMYFMLANGAFQSKSNEIKLLDNILFMSRGHYNRHYFIYTYDNKLYSFGNNYHNQTGIQYINKNYIIKEPTLIHFQFNGVLKQIECGKDHTLFLTDKGIVYGCGSSKKKQLLLNRNVEHLIKRIPMKFLLVQLLYDRCHPINKYCVHYIHMNNIHY